MDLSARGDNIERLKFMKLNKEFFFGIKVKG